MQKILKQSGFTILETIISLGIVMIGMIGVASLSQQNISAQNSNRNFLLASVLAQEAVELVRNQRDTNQRNGALDWKTGDNEGTNTDILQDDFGNVNYTIQYDGDIDPGVDNIDNAVLYITPGGLYVHDNGGGANIETPFRRLVTVTDYTDYISIIVLVKWNERGNNHEYQVDARLYDWW